MAARRFHGSCKVYNWGWDMLVATRRSFNGFPCMRYIGIYNVCVICASNMFEAFQKWFESF